MIESAARDFLAAHSWGILATNGDGGPYAVPVAYVVYDGAVCFACGPGQKQRYLREDPAACLTVAQVEDGHCWRSVVVRGEVEWVEGTEERLRILRALLTRAGRRPTLEEMARAARGSVCRVRVSEVSERSRGRLAA
jgi:nitroimidazol reductase NimA-like FMN-containing flavoprotein (pyridoxamine 5'-phosphate oxidase superfamily)